jgi:hypothetical protein
MKGTLNTAKVKMFCQQTCTIRLNDLGRNGKECRLAKKERKTTETGYK